VLHITNGDSAVAVLSQAVKGEFLPWRDVLHEGPVRAGLALEELSRERAAFIAECGWGPPEAVARDFRQRDERLRAAGGDEEVVLWFEHDLYDQLQLIQVLDWFAAHPHPRLTLVCEAEYLGTIQPARATALFLNRRPVAQAEFASACEAWRAFRSLDPRAVQAVDAQGLRFLGAALRRHLEEFPWTEDGLSRTERAVLEALREAPLKFGEIFVRIREDPAFLGDSVLAWHLERMKREGLLLAENNSWKAVGRGMRSRLPRWLGGVLVTEGSAWRWDAARGAIAALR
jgi:hypothetical protein